MGKSKYLEEEELELMREALGEHAWLPLAVSLETGLRVGDVVKLQKRNLHPDGLHYRAKKTGKAGKATISAALRRRLEQNRSGKWLFPSPYKPGKHLTRQCVWARVKRACEAQNIDPRGVSPHSMRKVFAVELYRERGFRAVQEALQHSNAATTEIYSFADWSTGENAESPLKRKDLELIVKMVIEALGDGYKLAAESKKKKRGTNPSS